MIGYIRAYKPELRVKEFEFYKAVYCSLCKYMGKEYGFLTRFTLSYDFTFLALLTMSLTDTDCKLEKKVCVCNPLKKCNFCIGCNNELDIPAAASVIMVYYNVLDNVYDEKGIKKAAYFILSKLLSRAHKKAAQRYPDIEKAVYSYVEAQNTLEKENCTDMDKAAEPTSAVLEKLLSLCSLNDKDRRALSRLGYCLGKYIYLLDALCDFSDDIKKGRYNVLKNYEDGTDRAKRNIYMCINESINAFELINILRLKNILGNIIYLGLEDTFKRSLSNERPV